MKNYFKKLSIMFVILLAVIGFGTIQNGIVANAASVGQQLTSPEDGWRRYEETDSNIKYIGEGWGENFGMDMLTIKQNDAEIQIKFYGTKFRVLGCSYYNRSSYSIIIDGVNYGSYSNSSTSGLQSRLVFQETDLPLQVHSVSIKSAKNYAYFGIDSIDIDKDGYLVAANSMISLDKSSMDLTVGDSKQLTATTTPAGAQVIWASSESSVASVDSTGKVTAWKEGQVTITATIAGESNLSAICVMTVTSEGTNPPLEPTDPTQPNVEPTNPTQPNDDANLFIELVDGNIKSYSVSNDQITKFKQWYIDRDNTTSNKPYYEFSKGTYKDFVIHDKIVWFEVR